MKLFLTCDAWWEARVGQALDEIPWTDFNRTLETRDYGEGVNEIAVVFMCRDPKFNFKKRVRFVKKDKILYLDIMLDLDQMKRLDDPARKRVLVEGLSAEIPPLLRKRSFPDFDTERFIGDFESWIGSIL